MKIKLFVGVLNLMALFSVSDLMGQNFQTMPVQSGYSADVIANGIGSSMTSTTMDVDGVSFAFVARDFQLTSSSVPLTYGIPSDGLINSVVAGTPGLTFKLGDLSANNSLRMAGSNDTGTLVFTTPKAAFKLYMLSTSGSGTSAVDVVVNFTDNTTQTFTNIGLLDWYDGANFAIQGIGRINRTNDVLESSSTNPRLYQTELAIDAANHAKPIQSVTITRNALGNGVSNIFAFSADAYSDCAAPTIQPVGTLTSTSAQVSWTVPPTTQASGYDLYYSTSSTTPTGSTTPSLPGLTGTSTTIGSLSPNTVYYYWVRTNCSTATGQSVWSFAGTFKTLCGPMTSMYENFDSYNTGSIVPDCWARIITNGSQTITSTTPASGTRNIYQYCSSSQTPSIVVLPEFSNINAGTHWLRLKARVTSATGTLNVGYVTDAADGSTFVPIQALSIANTNYTTAAAEYTVVVPASTPANARLAIKNTADGKSYYWDDVYWEQIPTCFAPTALTASNPGLTTVDLSWTAPSAPPANGYEYYYSTSSTAPDNTTTPSGTTAAGVTSTGLSNLNPSTNYYVWVRSACSANDKSAWSYVTTFKTLCGSIATMFENFDSYPTGSIVPDCWARIAGTGSQTITTTSPASGTRNIYQYTSSSATPSIAVLPTFTNVNAGTNQLRFKARVTSGTGTLNVGYVTDIADAASFVLIQAVTISSNSYSDSNSEYIVSVPTSVPANARLAIHSVNDGKSYYWDDVYWEALQLSTSDVNVKKETVKIHPNPFKDVVYISETKEIKSVMIGDLSGRVVQTIENPGKEINLSMLNSGLYLITIQFKDGSRSTVKAIKK